MNVQMQLLHVDMEYTGLELRKRNRVGTSANVLGQCRCGSQAWKWTRSPGKSAKWIEKRRTSRTRGDWEGKNDWRERKIGGESIFSDA